VSRIEREEKMLAARIEERVRTYEYEQQVQSIEDKHRKLDLDPELKRDFLQQQSVLAQQFFTQKLKIVSEQVRGVSIEVEL